MVLGYLQVVYFDLVYPHWIIFFFIDLTEFKYIKYFFLSIVKKKYIMLDSK